jgi:hypothetical protein
MMSPVLPFLDTVKKCIRSASGALASGRLATHPWRVVFPLLGL